MDRYEIILYWNDEDQAFITEIPEIAGLCEALSLSPDTAKNLSTCIGSWK